MSQTVAGILVDTLEKIGVRHIFGLIADSLNPIADAVRHSKIEWIGVRHEEGAALAAAGQAKLTGRLGVCCGTTGPGSTHLVAGLYEASRDHAPVLALSGDMPRKMQGTDYFQATDPNMLFRDVSLYTETISSPAQAPAVIHQAIAAAYAGRGVAHLTLPHRRHQREGRGRRFERRHAQAATRNRRQRSGYYRDRTPHRRSRQHRDHVRCWMSWRSRRIARALRSAQGAIDPFRQGQGHHALRRPALDGRHRHDRNEGRSTTPSCIAICF